MVTLHEMVPLLGEETLLAGCELPQRKARNEEQFLSDNQQDTEVLSLTACKKWMLPIVTGTWKGFLPQANLDVRLQPWPTS